MVTTVVFDLDDTLYDEIEYCRSGLLSVAEFLSHLPQRPAADVIFEAFWERFSSGNHTKVFNAALDRLGIAYDDKFITRLVEVYRNHVPKISLQRDSRDVLRQLKAKYTLALLTDGFLPAQQLKVQALGIEKYFKCLIYTEQLGREFWKPSTAGFEKIMQALNERSQNMVYVADNEEKDFIAPNKLGFSTIQIIRSARVHKNSFTDPFAAARHVIYKISQLPDLLEKL